jgi:hypothetical protein
MWDRDRWGGRFLWAPGASLAIGGRNTSGESTYLTGVFDVGVRWYVLRVIGLSLTPVRIEGGPKIHGEERLDQGPMRFGDVAGVLVRSHTLFYAPRLPYGTVSKKDHPAS